MRTSIFLGLLAIADAIRKDWMPTDESIVAFVSVTFVVMMFMDVADFIKNQRRP